MRRVVQEDDDYRSDPIDHQHAGESRVLSGAGDASGRRCRGGGGYPGRWSKFKAFLKQEGETVADIRFRVEINLIASRLAARHKGNQSAQTAAVESEIKNAFLAGTVCTPTVAMADCSNYHAPG